MGKVGFQKNIRKEIFFLLNLSIFSGTSIRI
jgi:hypothetical protein